MAGDMSKDTSVTTFERQPDPRPERKPDEAGLRGGELMRRGDAQHRRGRTVDDDQEPRTLGARGPSPRAFSAKRSTVTTAR